MLIDKFHEETMWKMYKNIYSFRHINHITGSGPEKYTLPKHLERKTFQV